MAHEIIITSVREGADKNRQGFCTVAHDRTAPAGLIRTLEEVSVYHHVYPPDSPEASQNPVAFSHTIFRQLGTVYHVVSRIGDAGIDFQLRSNHIAHHLVLEESELPPEGPTWLLLQSGIFLNEWVGPAVIFAQCRPIPTHTSSPYTIPPLAFSPDWFVEFQYQRGIETLIAAILHQRPVVIFYSPVMRLLPLLAETVRRLREEDRWKATFSTYYQTPSFDTPPLCLIQCVIKDSLESRLRTTPPHELTIDLTAEGAMFDPNERVADAAWQPPSDVVAAINEITPPPLPTPERTLRPHAAAQVVESMVRVRSPFVFYSVYGVSTLLVLLLLLLLVGQLFDVGPFRRHAATMQIPVAGVVVPTPIVPAPLAPQPVPVVEGPTPEEIAAAENAKLQELVAAAGPLLKEAREKTPLPPILPLEIPPDTGVAPPPKLFKTLAPFYQGGHVLEIKIVPAFVPSGWEFLTVKLPPVSPIKDDAPFVWYVIGRDGASGSEDPLMAIKLTPDGLAFEWLPAALEPLKRNDAALLTIGEIQFGEVGSETAFAAIPLWQPLLVEPVAITALFAEQNVSHSALRPLFFAAPPWSEVFEDRDPSSQFVFTVTPMAFDVDKVQPHVKKFETHAIDENTTQFLFTTNVYDSRKVDPFVVGVRVTFENGRVVVTDEAGVMLEATIAEKSQNADRLAAIKPEIDSLQGENFRSPDPAKTEQIEQLKKERKDLESRQIVCDDLIEVIPKARLAVATAVEIFKSQIGFSLAIKMRGEDRTMMLQTTHP
ncbi:MAG: hypothetical protein ACRC46_12795 [Thermoguttaceae bacterium]